MVETFSVCGASARAVHPDDTSLKISVWESFQTTATRAAAMRRTSDTDLIDLSGPGATCVEGRDGEIVPIENMLH